MDQQVIFSNLFDTQKDEAVFYSDADIINTENMIVYEFKPDIQSLDFGSDLQIQTQLDNAKQPTLKIPPTLKSTIKEFKKKPAKRWCQKEVAIKTMESEFNVDVWVLADDQDDNGKIKTEEEVNEKLQVSLLNNKQKPLPTGIKCTNKYCRRMFKSINKLREHLLKDHGTESSNLQMNGLDFACTSRNCSKIFNNIASLRKHMHTHGPKTKVCDECGKAFIDNSKLNRHLVVHTGEKPFQCSFAGCGKRFSLDFNLRTHARIHTGYKPFACTFEGCAKTFAQSTNLKSHRLIHFKKENFND